MAHWLEANAKHFPEDEREQMVKAARMLSRTYWKAVRLEHELSQQKTARGGTTKPVPKLWSPGRDGRGGPLQPIEGREGPVHQGT